MAVEGLAGLGLVLKPDHFMLDGDTVFVVDFGSVC